MFRKFFTIATLLSVSIGLSACATGENLSQSAPTIPAVTQGMSRIVVYRTNILGAAVQPKVFADGIETNTCQPNKVFYIDVPAGRHTLKAVTEATEVLVVDAKAGESTYVECSVGFGIIVGRANLEIVDNATGRGEVGSLVFGGVYKVQ